VRRFPQVWRRGARLSVPAPVVLLCHRARPGRDPFRQSSFPLADFVSLRAMHAPKQLCVLILEVDVLGVSQRPVPPAGRCLHCAESMPDTNHVVRLEAALELDQPYMRSMAKQPDGTWGFFLSRDRDSRAVAEVEMRELPGSTATVEHEARSRHVGRGVRAEEHNRLCVLIATCHATEWYSLRHSRHEGGILVPGYSAKT
jgi:hypothetical protein